MCPPSKALATKIETSGEITVPKCAGTCTKPCAAMQLFEANIADKRQKLIDDAFGTKPIIQSGDLSSLPAFLSVGG